MSSWPPRARSPVPLAFIFMWPAETTDCLVRVERHDARGAAPTREEEEEELGDLAAGNDWLASDAAAARASAGDASRPGEGGAGSSHCPAGPTRMGISQ